MQSNLYIPRRQDIDGLRGVAIVMTALFHAFPATVHGGYAAVSVFFTLAGYFAACSLVRIQAQYMGWQAVYRFLYGRASRLVFPYWLMILVSLCAAYFVSLPIDFKKFSDASLSAAAFISNVFFRRADSYFGPGSFENPYLHTWYISILMQLLVIFTFASVWGGKRGMRWVMATLLMGATAGGVAISALRGKDFAYYSVVARMPEFMLGAGAYLVESTGWVVKVRRGEKWKKVVSVVSVMAIVCMCLWADSKTVYASAWALAPSLGAVGLLLFSGGLVARGFSWRPLVYVGRVSYEFFLLHWPILALLRYRLNEQQLPLWLGVAALVMAFGLAVGWRWAVRRMNRNDCSLVVYVRHVALGAALVCLTFWLNGAMRRAYGKSVDLMTRDAFDMGSHGGKLFVGADTLGDVRSESCIVLLGNSHALTMKRYMDLFGKRCGYRVLAISLSEFPNLPGFSPAEFPTERVRRNWEQVIGPTMKILPEADVVVLVATWEAYDWTHQVEQLHSMLRKGQSLVVLGQYPRVGVNPLRENMGVVKRKTGTLNYAMIKTPLSRAVVKWAEEKENVAIVDLWRNEDFPDWPFYNDTLMYYDDNHLNIYGSEKYFVVSRERLDSALREVLGRIVK